MTHPRIIQGSDECKPRLAKFLDDAWLDKPKPSDYKELVAEKRPNLNISIDPPLLNAYREVVKGMGEREQWKVMSGAFLMFLESTPARREEFMNRAKVAREPIPLTTKWDREIKAAKKKAGIGDEIAPILHHPPMPESAPAPERPASKKKSGKTKHRSRLEQ